MKEKYLEVRKENIFSKLSIFFRNIFKKKETKELPQELVLKEKKEVQNNEDVNIKNEENEEDRLLELQTKFENNVIDIGDISDDDLELLYHLYKKQNDGLRKILEDKLNQLEIIKNRINNYKNEM